MSDGQVTGAGKSEGELRDMVAAADTGARSPRGVGGRVIAGVAVAWSLFQLWIASPLPFLFADIVPVTNSGDDRQIHLAFSLFLAFAAYPALARSPRGRVPVLDWLLAVAAAGCCLYLLAYSDQIARRMGAPTTADLVSGAVGIVLLLEATRRTLGPPLAIVALVFMAYVFFGNSAYVPDVIRWAGASFNKAMSHLWITSEGVFGIALGVSASFVFLFVLFGSLLDRAGAGNYFIKLAFALLGHMRGGPAKAAVLASAMTGLISGSSIANVVTTGTFTIPLMKRVGFSAEKAGSVEVAASVNGQIMPPVMGAAAFLMVEYVGISYVDVIRHAFLPAIISYIALLYLVHLEAVKAGMRGLPKPGGPRRLSGALLSFGIRTASVVVLTGLVYYGIVGLRAQFGDMATPMLALIVAVAYLGLLVVAAREADLEVDDPRAAVEHLPEVGPAFRSGLHYLLPIVVLVWCLIVERLSPGLSAFWATMLLIAIVLTQRPLKSALRRAGGHAVAFRRGFDDLVQGLIVGARNMIGIGVATATAGIVVGTVTLTGIGQVMAEFVEFVSAGNLLLMLVMTAVISLVLGMGLPTTANYIVVSALMAPVIVELGAQSGLVVPLIAVHLFVFYFGIMADVTPPVGLASFAAAAVSGGDPIRTGVTAFFYSLRTVILPFLFIFNTDLLLIDVGPVDAILVFLVATGAMLIFAAATQGWFLTRSRLWESAALLLVAFTLFRPGFWLDLVDPPYVLRNPAEVVEVAGEAPPGGVLRVRVEGMDIDGRDVGKMVELPLGTGADGEERLRESAGLELRFEDGRALVDMVGFGSPAEELGIDFDWEIVAVQVPAERMPKQVFYLPALLLFGLVVLVQRRRAAGAA